MVDLEVQKAEYLYQITKMFMNHYQINSATRDYCQIHTKKICPFKIKHIIYGLFINYVNVVVFANVFGIFTNFSFF